ncbi:MAG TPA: type II toxin-antitoxin system PemK/MazF family toxin [Spirochaetales bacterium]|nr:type II toxin-antitoxin system PemK/MazF family toxin [Spirochaetales bacterium]
MTRGEVFRADFGLPFGSETGFRRPVVVMQSDAFNASRIGTVLVVPLTTKLALADAPGNVFVEARESGLSSDSVAVVSQLAAVDRRRLLERAGALGQATLARVELGLKLVLDLS